MKIKRFQATIIVKKIPFLVLVLLIMQGGFFGHLWAGNISYKRVHSNYYPVDARFSDSDIAAVPGNISVPLIYNNGVLFSYLGYGDDEVYVATSFLNWKKRIKMKALAHGVFSVFIRTEYLPAGDYQYLYLVNGIWQKDPSQLYVSEDDYSSFFRLDETIEQRSVSPKRMAYREYRFFLEDKDYKRVSWIGDANNWDPLRTFMLKKGRYWSIDIRLDAEQTLYAFYVDGKILLDPLNPYIGKTAHSLKVSRMLKELYFVP